MQAVYRMTLLLLCCRRGEAGHGQSNNQPQQHIQTLAGKTETEEKGQGDQDGSQNTDSHGTSVNTDIMTRYGANFNCTGIMKRYGDKFNCTEIEDPANLSVEAIAGILTTSSLVVIGVICGAIWWFIRTRAGQEWIGICLE